MKTISKFISAVSVSVFSVSVLAAVPVYARNGGGDDLGGSSSGGSGSQQVKPAENSGSGGVFCKSFDMIVTKTTSEVSKRGSSSDGKWKQSASDIAAKRAEWAAKVAAARAEAAKQREANFAKLDTAATTDAQKAAVVKYKETVLAAVATRQAAYDANFDAYFKAVDALLASQKDNSGGDVNGFKAAVSAAVEKAKASCAAGVSSDTVKNQLKTDLKAARESFKSQRSTDKNSIKEQLKALKETRKTANAKARDAFKSTLEAARTELKAAFPSTESETL